MDPMIGDGPFQLCVTHSTLVTRVFEAAMSLRGTPAGDVRTLSRRGAPFRGTGLRVDQISNELEECFKTFKRSEFRAAIDQLDAILDNLTGGKPFEAYIPHANKILYQEIICHRNCVGYSYLEEGFTSMAWSNRRNSRTSGSKLLRSHLRSWWVGARYRFNRKMFDHTLPGYQAAFAISDLAFCGMPGRRDVAAYLPPLAVGNPPGNTYIILDAIYLFQGIRWEDYENALVGAMLGGVLPAGDLLVKFHFADTEATRKFESLSQRLSATGLPPLRLLDAGFAVEENLTKQDLLLFAVTAMGYYAALTGVRCNCFASEIKGLSIPALVAAGKLPGDFERIAGLGRS